MQHVRPLGALAQIDLDALETLALLEQPDDGPGPERRHGCYSDAMSRSTRSSRDLNGSLQSTVRCAWSLSFRCTQSTV